MFQIKASLAFSTKHNRLMEFLLLICFSLIISLSSGTDSISANNSLSGNQIITSKGDNFVLGFFKPGNSSNYYVGIWYTKVSLITVVWVANRETPVSDRFSSELKVIDGNLVLLNESKLPIWSTNVTTTNLNSNSVLAVIRDDGNLVLTDGSNSVEPVWQSFDHPTHTFLPGSKLGYSNRTNTKQVITSWRSPEDPAVGLFSLEIDQNEKQMVLNWNNSVQYWASGSWDGRIFSSVREMSTNYLFNVSYHTNEKESYFIYYLYDTPTISRFVVDVSGQLQQLTWMQSGKQWNYFWAQPRTECEVYALCGAFATCRKNVIPFCNCLTGFKPRSENNWNLGSFSDGCVRKTDLSCGIKEEKTEFIVYYVPLKFLTTFTENKRHVSDESACRKSCLDDCKCDAYSFKFQSCCIWNGENLNNISRVFLSDDSNSDTLGFNIKVASKNVPPNDKNNGVHVGVVVGFVVGVVIVLSLIFLIIYRKKRILVGKTIMEGLLVAFAYRDLQMATKNFSDKLGGGGFGSVFKGVLCDSSIVAVKKLESISQGEKQFRSEVSTLGTIQHVNLVRLRGFCAQGDHKLLVYDYMPNGSLNSHLFHENQDNVLSWKTRYDIALGIARGLVYLHEKCRDCIIHCDIKPENILLDADFHPKIADFGLAKLVGRDFSRVLTTMRGTRGYLAPEWLSGLAITAKADVYSYGMMLFELLHGKRNSQQSQDSSFTFFPSLAAIVAMEGGDILSLVDIKLNREANIKEVTKIIKIAYWCIEDEEESRPSMSKVEQFLEGILDVNMPPIPKIVQFFIDSTDDHALFFTKSSSNGTSQVLRNLSAGGNSQSKSASS